MPSPSSAPHEQGGPSMEETITVACIIDCPTIMIHAGKCYKALISSGANISLLWYFYLQEHWRQLQDPHTAHYSQIEHSRWFPCVSPRHDSPTFEDSGIQIHTQICNLWQTPGYRDYLWHRYSKEHFHMLGTRTRIVIYKEMANS